MSEELTTTAQKLLGKVQMLLSAIERRNFPFDLVSETAKHDCMQAMDWADDKLNELFEDWTNREFDGVEPRDQYAEFRHPQHERLA